MAKKINIKAEDLEPHVNLLLKQNQTLKLNSLDLSKCDNTNIQINYLIKNNNTLNYSSISFYKDIGVDILNIYPYVPFWQDI